MGHKADRNDVCHNQKQELLGSNDYYTRSVVEGVVAGAFVGAALGAVSAAIAGGNIGRGAAIGAGGGAFAGGIAAYFNAKQQNNADAAALADSIRGDLVRENGEIDRVSISFAHLRDCRFAAAQRIKTQYRNGAISRDEAQQRLTELRRQFDDDIRIAEEYGTKIGENSRSFQYASDQVLDRDPDSRLMLAQYHEEMAEYDANEAAGHISESAPAKSCGKKKKCGQKAAKVAKKATGKKESTKVAKAKPAVRKSPAVETAIAAESNQRKSKELGDTLSKSKAAANQQFDLDAKTDGPLGLGPLDLDRLPPENLVCGLP